MHNKLLYLVEATGHQVRVTHIFKSIDAAQSWEKDMWDDKNCHVPEVWIEDPTDISDNEDILCWKKLSTRGRFKPGESSYIMEY